MRCLMGWLVRKLFVRAGSLLRNAGGNCCSEATSEGKQKTECCPDVNASKSDANSCSSDDDDDDDDVSGDGDSSGEDV